MFVAHGSRQHCCSASYGSQHCGCESARSVNLIVLKHHPWIEKPKHHIIDLQFIVETAFVPLASIHLQGLSRQRLRPG